MKSIEEVRAKIMDCDKRIEEALTERMNHIKNIVEFKKADGIPILEPEKEKKSEEALEAKLAGHEYEEELLDIFRNIAKNSSKVQTKTLFSYNIMLIGFMGAGKSSVSSYLSKLLVMDEIDMDSLIAEKEGMSIPNIFDKHGEEYFRNAESNTLIELKESKQSIISCGGGVVLRPKNVEIMKEYGRIVLLTAEPETILERVRHSNERPILNGNMNVEFIEELMAKRRDYYLNAADVIVATDGKTIQQVCEEIVEKVTEME